MRFAFLLACLFAMTADAALSVKEGETVFRPNNEAYSITAHSERVDGKVYVLIDPIAAPKELSLLQIYKSVIVNLEKPAEYTLLVGVKEVSITDNGTCRRTFQVNHMIPIKPVEVEAPLDYQARKLYEDEEFVVFSAS